MIMLFKGNSSRLEHLIEKIQANKENHDVTSEDIKEALGSVGSTAGSSWPSSTPEPSPSPASTPTSADAADAEAEPPFTLGATEHTPYQCQFCDKAFPRLSYLKKHEQSRCVDMHRSRCTARCRAEGCDVSGHYAGRTSRLLCVAPISPRYDYDTRRDRSS
uniref:SFRICE_034190 n=1 Tax=Spodoptera frugiperda TaxID=7108 RepID=A0A2H1VFF6_SPOFR